MKQIEYPELPESLRQVSQIGGDLASAVEPIAEQRQALREKITSLTEQFEAVKDLTTPIVPGIPAIVSHATVEASAVRTASTMADIGELAMRSAISDRTFQSWASMAAENITAAAASNLAASLKSLIESTALNAIQMTSSVIGEWLEIIDFSPLLRILDDIRPFGFEFDPSTTNKTFFKVVFDARWFPCTRWTDDFRLMSNVLQVFNTSKASKNRTKRIDKLIFSYYNKDTLNDLKRGWRQKNLPSYMTRILVQSIQAYHRREYALTVSALVTLWEGIIQDKASDSRYRTSTKTRENLTKLIEENKSDRIIASFCEEFIFYHCKNREEVKPDVPGRHCIAHSWYNTYPNRKMALNAILFTDFLLELKPLDKTEETPNG